MPRPIGGYVNKYVPPTAGAAVGVWSLREQTSSREANIWPTGILPTTFSNLSLWLDAADASTLYDATSGGSLVAADGAVARWEDKSGNANHVTQSTSNNRPARKTSIQNGRDVLRFDGTNDSFTRASLQWANGGFSMFVVCARTTLNGSYPAIVAEYSSTSGGYLALGMNTGSGGSSEIAIHRTGQATAASNLLPTAGRMRIVDYVSAGISGGSATVTVRMDGVAASSTLTLTSLSSNSDVGICASKGGTADFFNGDIAELLLFKRQLGSDEVSIIERYLGTKWGITL